MQPPRSHRWLRDMCDDCPALLEAMPDLRLEAYRTVTRWQSSHRELLRQMFLEVTRSKVTSGISFLRMAAKGAVNFLRRVQRSSTQTHPVLRLFNVPLTAPLQKRDRVLLLTTMWLGAMCTSIWFQAEKAVECCRQASVSVGCRELPSTRFPCHTPSESHDNCRTIVLDAALKDLEFKCTAFPTGSWPDIVIQTLIVLAIMIPVDLILSRLVLIREYPVPH